MIQIPSMRDEDVKREKSPKKKRPLTFLNNNKNWHNEIIMSLQTAVFHYFFFKKKKSRYRIIVLSHNTTLKGTRDIDSNNSRGHNLTCHWMKGDPPPLSGRRRDGS